MVPSFESRRARTIGEAHRSLMHVTRARPGRLGRDATGALAWQTWQPLQRPTCDRFTSQVA